MRLSVYTVNGAEITTLNLPRDSTMQWATKHGLRCIAAHVIGQGDVAVGRVDSRGVRTYSRATGGRCKQRRHAA